MGQNKSRKCILGLVAGLMMTVLLVSGCGQPTVEEKAPAVAVSVKSEAAKIDNITEWLVVSGKIIAKQEVNVMSTSGGIVKKVNVAVGDTVKKGQVLAELENDAIIAQLKQAKTGLATAQAAYNDAKKTLERMESLYSEGAISLAQLEQARLGVQSANPQSAASGVELLQIQYDYTILKSPINGIVSACNVVVGGMAGPSNPVATVVNMDSVKMQSTVTEDSVNKLSVGQKVDVLVKSVSAEPFPGTVTMVAPAAGSQTLAFPVEITVPNKEHGIKPGMFAEVRLATASQEQTVVIPKEAVMDNLGVQRVFVINSDQTVSLKEIETGIHNDAYIQVLSGIADGEKVVIKGQDKLEDGVLVDDSTTVTSQQPSVGGGDAADNSTAAKNEVVEPGTPVNEGGTK